MDSLFLCHRVPACASLACLTALMLLGGLHRLSTFRSRSCCFHQLRTDESTLESVRF